MTSEEVLEFEVVRRARDFAVWAHGDQRYGDLPHIAHLDLVFAMARKFQAPRDVQIAAYLHDVLEDTNVGASAIFGTFGPTVGFLVEAVTDKPGTNRLERHAKTYPKTSGAGRDAILLKLCDRIANVQASLGTEKMSMYRGEYAGLFESSLRTPEVEHRRAWDYLDALYAMDRVLNRFQEHDRSKGGTGG